MTLFSQVVITSTLLRRLSEFADRVDLLHPGRRLALESRTVEVVVLSDAINRMLTRLEQERRSSTGCAARARPRGRTDAGRIAKPAVADLGGARASLEDVRRIATELRPEALDELGLPSPADNAL